MPAPDQYVLVCQADDRVGLIFLVSDAVSRSEGNILATRVDVVGSKAVIVLRLETYDPAPLEAALHAMSEEHGLHSVLQRMGPADEPTGQIDNLRILSSDAPGLLAEVGTLFQTLGVSVLALVGEQSISSERSYFEHRQNIDLYRPCPREDVDRGLAEISRSYPLRWQWGAREPNRRLTDLLFQDDFPAFC